MANKKEKKSVLVIFVEGDTEVDFYKKMIATIRQKIRKPKCEIEVKNVKGVGNYQNKVCCIFKAKCQELSEPLGL